MARKERRRLQTALFCFRVSMASFIMGAALHMASIGTFSQSDEGPDGVPAHSIPFFHRRILLGTRQHGRKAESIQETPTADSSHASLSQAGIPNPGQGAEVALKQPLRIPISAVDQRVGVSTTQNSGTHTTSSELPASPMLPSATSSFSTSTSSSSSSFPKPSSSSTNTGNFPSSTSSSSFSVSSSVSSSSASTSSATTAATTIPTSSASSDAIHAHLAFPGTQVCGSWHERYSSLHRSVRSGLSKPKYLTFRPSPSTGLGDNLLGLVSAFIAALVSERTFVIADSDIADVFEPGEIDWREHGGVPMVVDAFDVGGIREGCVFLLRRMNGGASLDSMVQFPSDLVQLFSMKLGPAANVIVETNGGILTRVLDDQNGHTYKLLERLGLATPAAFGCILRYLIRPRTEVVALVEQPLRVLLAPGQHSVCVHMRTKDEYAWDPETGEARSNLTRTRELFEAAERTLLSCAYDVGNHWAPAGSQPLWLFLSDIRGLQGMVKEKYKEKVLISPNQPLHPSIQGRLALPSAVADWLLMSACHSYVITESGFSKTSAAYNLKNPHYYLFKRDDISAQIEGTCNPKKPNTLADFKMRSGL